jgi:hypothetical protein
MQLEGALRATLVVQAVHRHCREHVEEHTWLWVEREVGASITEVKKL